MEKINEIRKTLQFYICTNELKNKIIDEPNNYSVADHLYGSMILATAIDSEFKETNDLSKIFRMMFLSEFVGANPNYDFKNLKLGKQYYDEILEARDMNGQSGRLVFKYKMLDFLLTELIKKKETNISQFELIKEGSIIISSLCGKQPHECEEIFRFYYLNFRLKNKIRTGWDNKHWNIKSDRIETVSEHVIGTFGLALAMNSEFENNIDVDKELKTIVIHELGETIIGDITPFDGITPEEKKEMEHCAMKDVLGNLKEKDILLSSLFAFDERKTPEDIHEHYLDKIEADLQSKIFQDKGMHHSLDDQENNVVFNSSKVKKMVENGAKNAFDIWFEWDKTIYEGDEKFPEFINILRVARANDLTNLGMTIRERIDLTNEEHSFLSQELVGITKELYKDENIDSAYVANFQGSNGKGTINVVALLKSRKNKEKYDKLIEKLNSKIAKVNNTDVNVILDYDLEDEYPMIAMHSSEVYNVELLAESKIIFDKSGKISEIQEEYRKYNQIYGFALVDYVPPVEEAAYKEMQAYSGEENTTKKQNKTLKKEHKQQ